MQGELDNNLNDRLTKLLNNISFQLYEISSANFNEKLIDYQLNINKIPNNLPKNKFSSYASQVHEAIQPKESNNEPIMSLLSKLFNSYSLDPFENMKIKFNEGHIDTRLSELHLSINHLFEIILNDSTFSQQIVLSQLYIVKSQDSKTRLNELLVNVPDLLNIIDDVFSYPFKRMVNLKSIFESLTKYLNELNDIQKKNENSLTQCKNIQHFLEAVIQPNKDYNPTFDHNSPENEINELLTEIHKLAEKAKAPFRSEALKPKMLEDNLELDQIIDNNTNTPMPFSNTIVDEISKAETSLSTNTY